VRFAFAGTPEFGAHVLRDLLDRGVRPVLVVSQPDRPAGRGRRLVSPAVTAAARQNDLPVLQTADINTSDVQAALVDARVECLIVASFGQLLRSDILAAFFCLNVHASLLPAYRGAAPIVRALMAGETEIGVSLMRMTAGLDEGPWALQRRLSVTRRDDAGTVGRALALLGALGVAEVFESMAEGEISWTDQTGGTTYAVKVGSADRVFDPRLNTRRLHDRVRALSPDIGCEARSSGGLALKIWRTWPRETTPPGNEPPQPRPGRVTREKGRLFVDCCDGALELVTVQPAGKRPMRASELLRGYESRLGESLELPPEGGWERQS
jgi:methionyl-tRNA formyltransferase